MYFPNQDGPASERRAVSAGKTRRKRVKIPSVSLWPKCALALVDWPNHLGGTQLQPKSGEALVIMFLTSRSSFISPFHLPTALPCYEESRAKAGYVNRGSVQARRCEQRVSGFNHGVGRGGFSFYLCRYSLHNNSVFLWQRRIPTEVREEWCRPWDHVPNVKLKGIVAEC